MKILLFTQFYISDNNNRNIENKYSLHKNYHNKYIDHIYLLNERIYSDEELGLYDSSSKIKQINISNRLQYSAILTFILENNLQDNIIVISNLDIYFDDSINYLYNDNFINNKICYSLRRWETYKNKIQCDPYLFTNENDSSNDVWCLYGKYIDKDICKQSNILLGTFCCENFFHYVLAKNNFYLINDPYSIKTYHSDSTTTHDKIFSRFTFEEIISHSTDFKYFNNIPDEHTRKNIRQYDKIAYEVPVVDINKNIINIGLVITSSYHNYYIFKLLSHFFTELGCKVELVKKTGLNRLNRKYIDEMSNYKSVKQKEYYAKYDIVIIFDNSTIFENNSYFFEWKQFINNSNCVLKKRTIIITSSLIRKSSEKYIYNLFNKHLLNNKKFDKTQFEHKLTKLKNKLKYK